MQNSAFHNFELGGQSTRGRVQGCHDSLGDSEALLMASEEVQRPQVMHPSLCRNQAICLHGALSAPLAVPPVRVFSVVFSDAVK